MPRQFDAIRSKIRQILLDDWDPSNARRFEAASGEYDSYVDPLYDLIAADGTEEHLVEYLRERERESMCFPGLDSRRLKPVARKLLALKPQTESLKVDRKGPAHTTDEP